MNAFTRNMRVIFGVGLSSILLSLTACGDTTEGNAEQTGDGDSLTSISVGTIAIASSVELRYGVENGIFEKHGLDVELVESQGGAAMVPGVQNGSLDFGVGNPMSVLTAADQGLPMKIVSGYSWSSSEGEDINAIITRADSGIEEWSDLENTTVSVNAIHTLGDLSTMEAVSMNGGDPGAVDFNEMPFPDMLPQLEVGNVDAIWVPEPFLGRALGDEENIVVGYPNQEVMEGMPLTIAFTSEAVNEESPDVVESFKTALTESTEQAWDDEQALRNMLTEFLEMDEETAQTMRLEPARTDLPVEDMQTIYDLMLKYNMAEDPLDASELYID